MKTQEISQHIERKTLPPNTGLSPIPHPPSHTLALAFCLNPFHLGVSPGLLDKLFSSIHANPFGPQGFSLVIYLIILSSNPSPSLLLPKIS